jgi:pimeloyl-ACP methyl ester carboxylesterase
MQAEIWGSGPRVILIHGAVTNGGAAWSKQKPLADRWELVVVNRPGFAPNPVADRCDFASDALEIAEMLDQPAHLVGHSYGGLIALLTAAQRPEAVRSLTVVEPAVMSLTRGDPDTERTIDAHKELLDLYGDDPQAFLAHFTTNLGGDPASVPNPLPPVLLQHVRLLMHERPPWEAVIPTEVLSRAPFPKLVVSGRHSPLQERMGDTLAEAIRPNADRAVIEGAGHIVQRNAEAFNARIERFLSGVH